MRSKEKLPESVRPPLTRVESEAQGCFTYLQDLLIKGDTLPEALEELRRDIAGRGKFGKKTLVYFDALVKKNGEALEQMARLYQNELPRREVDDPLLRRSIKPPPED